MLCSYLRIRLLPRLCNIEVLKLFETKIVPNDKTFALRSLSVSGRSNCFKTVYELISGRDVYYARHF